LQHRPEGHIRLPNPSAKREERAHHLKFHEHNEPRLVKKAFEEALLLRPASNPDRRSVEAVNVSTSDEDSGLADGSPLRLRKHVAVFVSDRTPHVDSRHVASRDVDVRVILAVGEGPENGLRVLGRALARSSLEAL
jgi:hypothetical protein